jgi:hypothetical protein
MHRVFIALLFGIASPAMAGGPLSIGTGTAELGGSATVDLLLGDNNNGSSASLTLAPRAGYFLADRAELIGGVSLNLGNGVTGYGLSVGGRYVTPMGGNHAYVGGLFNYGETTVLDFFVTNRTSVSAIGGFLLPFGPKVAADIGMRINIPLEDGPVHIPIGYLGVSAFFP